MGGAVQKVRQYSNTATSKVSPRKEVNFTPKEEKKTNGSFVLHRGK